jgi:uncharacterized protein YjbI with pentapeptide repeats
VEGQLERFADRESLLGAKGKDGALVNADISFLDLRDLDLSGLDLSGALLTGSDLRGVNLAGCNLDELFAQDAVMDGACLRDARFCQGLFQRVSLARVDFSGSDLTETKLFLCDLQESIFAQTTLVGVELLGCDLSRASFEFSNLEGAVLRESELAGAEFISCNLGKVDFRKATLLSASYQSVVVAGALFYGQPPWDGDSLDRDWGGIMPSFDGE